AQNDDKSTYLIALQEKSTKIGIPTYFLSKKFQISQEPYINAIHVLVSPTTRIIDSQAFINWLEWVIENNYDLNSRIRFGSNVLYIQKPNDYEINADESRKDTFSNTIKTYLLTIKRDKLYANYTGIR
ncbi:16551_t:CDS:2, partial [Gigaspora margarita]